MNDYVENGIIYENDTKTKIFGSKKDISNILIIPDGVTSIGNGAFNGCTRFSKKEGSFKSESSLFLV